MKKQRKDAWLPPARKGNRTRFLALLSCGALATIPCLAAGDEKSAGDSKDVAAILAASKAAMGGTALDTLRTLHLTSTISGVGLTGTQQEWDDVLGGRSATTGDLGPLTQMQGFDGHDAWEQDQGAPTRLMTSSDDRQAAVSNAYCVSMSYWYPGRRPGTVTYLRAATDGARRCDVLQVAPEGGYPFEMWIDRATHFIDRTVEPQATQTVTTTHGRYTAVAGGAWIPFVTTVSDGTAKYDTVATTQHIDVNPPVSDARFAPPSPGPAMYTFAGGVSSVTVPFTYKNAHIYIPISINGQPFSAIFDSGGVYLVSPDVAGRLKLKPQGAAEGNGFGTQKVDTGFARADTVRIGGLTLRQPLFYVVDIPPIRDSPLVGYELLQQFVVTLDYDRDRLTLTRPDRYTKPTSGIVVPFRFNDRTPEVDGTVDGIPGVFTIDTGSGTGLSLAGPFVAAHRLDATYHAAYRGVTGFGVGGPEHAAVTRAHTLTLGGIAVHDPVTELDLDQAGDAANKAVAGNIGEPVLRQFNVTLDYAAQQIVFEKNKHYGEREAGSRSGMAVDGSVMPPVVIDVFAGGAAVRAGIGLGDRIESINGRAIKTLADYDAVSGALHAAAGSKVTLVVRSKGKLRTVVLVLRDLV